MNKIKLSVRMVKEKQEENNGTKRKYHGNRMWSYIKNSKTFPHQQKNLKAFVSPATDAWTGI